MKRLNFLVFILLFSCILSLEVNLQHSKITQFIRDFLLQKLETIKDLSSYAYVSSYSSLKMFDLKLDMNVPAIAHSMQVTYEKNNILINLGNIKVEAYFRIERPELNFNATSTVNLDNTRIHLRIGSKPCGSQQCLDLSIESISYTSKLKHKYHTFMAKNLAYLIDSQIDKSFNLYLDWINSKAGAIYLTDCISYYTDMFFPLFEHTNGTLGTSVEDFLNNDDYLSLTVDGMIKLSDKNLLFLDKKKPDLVLKTSHNYINRLLKFLFDSNTLTHAEMSFNCPGGWTGWTIGCADEDIYVLKVDLVQAVEVDIYPEAVLGKAVAKVVLEQRTTYETTVLEERTFKVRGLTKLEKTIEGVVDLSDFNYDLTQIDSKGSKGGYILSALVGLSVKMPNYIFDYAFKTHFKEYAIQPFFVGGLDFTFLRVNTSQPEFQDGQMKDLKLEFSYELEYQKLLDMIDLREFIKKICWLERDPRTQGEIVVNDKQPPIVKEDTDFINEFKRLIGMGNKQESEEPKLEPKIDEPKKNQPEKDNDLVIEEPKKEPSIVDRIIPKANWLPWGKKDKVVLKIDFKDKVGDVDNWRNWAN